MKSWMSKDIMLSVMKRLSIQQSPLFSFCLSPFAQPHFGSLVMLQGTSFAPKQSKILGYLSYYCLSFPLTLLASDFHFTKLDKSNPCK